METKDVSKAQLEVWEWKEKAARQVSDLPPGERIRAIVQRTKPLVSALKKRKIRVVRRRSTVIVLAEA